VVLCQSLRCTTRSSGDTLPRLNRLWKQFSVSGEERQHRLELALDFHAAGERVRREERRGGERERQTGERETDRRGGERERQTGETDHNMFFPLLQVLLQECADSESLDEVDSSGKTLLDRLTLPVIFPDG